jgi:hypothetical protein
MPFGHEILFVGSGGVFHYRDQATAKRNLHRELMHLIRKRERTLPLRRFRSRGPIYQARQAMRWLMGRSQQDLYDLALWTEFESEAGLLATDVRRP